MGIRMEVPLAEIETELSRLWDEEKSKNRFKACLFNLVVYTEDMQQEPFLQELVNGTLEKFPCRVLFIQADPNRNNDYLRAYVSNEAITTAFGCDQITLEYSASRAAAIPYIITSHLVPDLPVYLIWGADPSQDRGILNYLQQFTNRLIFNPGSTDTLQKFCAGMLARIAAVDCEVVDLHWGFISGWREVLARTFDTEERTRQLKFSKTIKITYNTAKAPFFPAPEIQATYLSSWLAGQLGWTFLSASNGCFTFSSGTHQVKVELVPKEADGLIPGAIMEIEVTTAEDHAFILTRKQKLPKVVVHISTTEICELPFTLPLKNTQIGLGYIKGLFYQPSCKHYKNMLQIASQIKESP